MPADKNNPSAPDLLSFTEEDSSWLEEINFDESLAQLDADLDPDSDDWLAKSLNNVSTGSNLGVNLASQERAVSSKLDKLFADMTDLPVWEDTVSNADLRAWERDWETSSSSSEEQSDWSDDPTSTAEAARQEAEAWDEKDQYAQPSVYDLSKSIWETTETIDIASAGSTPTTDREFLMEESTSFPPPEDFQQVFDNYLTPQAPKKQPSDQGLDQVIDQIIGEQASADYDPQESAFARPSYLDTFELDPAVMDGIDIDIDLDKFGSSAVAATPPLHEIFSASELPPLPPQPNHPTTGGDSKWSNTQMSTTLNPDRKPFESAPPALITDVVSINHDLLAENTDWSGLLLDESGISPAPQPAPPRQQNLPPLPPKVVSPRHSPKAPLYQEVSQFQELLEDSNLSGAETPLPAVEDVTPLHSRLQPGEALSESPPKNKLRNKPKIQLPTLPQLPWAQIAKVSGIGAGVIALLWGGSIVFDRPITQLGLRIGIWKDVRGKDLSRMDLSGGNLRGANLSKANLRGANLTRANLSISNLASADLTGANLTGATIRGANLQGTRIGKRGTREVTRLDREAFLVWQAVNERLDGLNMSRLHLLGVNLNDASLLRANFTNSNLSFATFRGANLTGANLRGANLESADLSDANLSGANFRDANWGKNPPTSSESTTCPDRTKGPCEFEKFR